MLSYPTELQTFEQLLPPLLSSDLGLCAASLAQ